MKVINGEETLILFCSPATEVGKRLMNVVQSFNNHIKEDDLINRVIIVTNKWYERPFLDVGGIRIKGESQIKNYLSKLNIEIANYIAEASK